MSDTNYWRIKDMLEYEFADFLATIADCARCPMLCECEKKTDCCEHWFKWLQKEGK